MTRALFTSRRGPQNSWRLYGAMWRGKYDMAPDEFTKRTDRLWDQVSGSSLSLHAYVRMKLHDKYGDAVPAEGPIPAYMLGKHLVAGLVERLIRSRRPPVAMRATRSATFSNSARRARSTW